MALAALFPLKTTSRTTINLECLTGSSVYMYSLSVCVWRGIPKKGVFLHLTEQE